MRGDITNFLTQEEWEEWRLRQIIASDIQINVKIMFNCMFCSAFDNDCLYCIGEERSFKSRCLSIYYSRTGRFLSGWDRIKESFNETEARLY